MALSMGHTFATSRRESIIASQIETEFPCPQNNASLAPANRARSPARKPAPQTAWARCRNGTWPTSMPGSTIRNVKRDLDRADAECIAFEEAYKGKLAALAERPGRRHVARRGGEALTRSSTICSAGSSPLPASSMPATRSIRRARNSMATCRSASPPRPRICCSSRSSSTASTMPSSKPRCAIRRSVTTGLGSRTSARTSPISSRTASSSSSTRSR